MECQQYKSCIKINGIPILPPVMTEDIRQEMRHYKQLAIALEKRSKSFDAAKNTKINAFKHTQNGKQNYDNSPFKFSSNGSETDNSDCESITYDTTVNTMTVLPVDISLEKKVDASAVCDTPIIDTSTSKLTGDNLIQNKISLLENAVSGSESVTVSTELNGCLNNTISTMSTTTETIPEIGKPQTPKTLDILPITLDEPMKNKDASNSEIVETNNMGDTPKLIRQGSYILDTPSPLLLAHMQLGSTDGDYVLNESYTPTVSTATTRREEWNITQPKMDWVKQSDNKKFKIVDSSKTLKYQRNNTSATNQRIYKSMHHRKKKTSLKLPYSMRSVNCIQAMLAKEYIRKCNIKPEAYSQTPSNCETQAQRTNQYSTIPDLTNNQSGSLGNITVNMQNTNQTRINHNDIFRNKGCNERFVGNSGIQSKNKINLYSTSEKLLAMLRDIHEMHKKQMLNLISRQQKEQTLLQQKFERQQEFLLTHIKKSFPELPSLASVQNKPPSDIEKINDSNEESDYDIGERTVRPLNLVHWPLNQWEKDKNAPQSEHIQMLPSLTCNHIIKEHNKPQQQNNTCCLETQSSKDDVLNAVLINTTGKAKYSSISNNEDSRLQKGHNKKQLSVSRQLFCLDSNTTPVPILDYPVYTERHIKAATIINAYTKGYLVRRLMITDHVTTLRNTYKEALQCMLRLHVDAPLDLPELNFLHRLQLQCDAASMNIVELFAQPPGPRMQIIAHDRDIKRFRVERSPLARSYSFATQRTLARKKVKEMKGCEPPLMGGSNILRARCQTWTSDIKEKPSTPHATHPNMKRSTSAGAIRRPWR